MSWDDYNRCYKFAAVLYYMSLMSVEEFEYAWAELFDRWGLIDDHG